MALLSHPVMNRIHVPTPPLLFPLPFKISSIISFLLSLRLFDRKHRQANSFRANPIWAFLITSSKRTTMRLHVHSFSSFFCLAGSFVLFVNLHARSFIWSFIYACWVFWSLFESQTSNLVRYKKRVTDQRTNQQLDQWTDQRTNGRTNGWTDGRTDRAGCRVT